MGWGLFSKLLFSAISLGVCKKKTKEEIDLSKVLQIHHRLAWVFSKQQALALPPHRPYDCAKDLLPGAYLPSSRLNNMSGPENETMTQYINNSLKSGIIHPSPLLLELVYFSLPKKTFTNSSRTLLSSPNSTSAMPIICSEFVKRMNGKLPLRLLSAILSTWLCLSGWPTTQPFFRSWLTMS